MKRSLLSLLVFMSLALPSAAWATTPVYGNFQFKMGGWYPDVDGEFGGGATPFQDIYGDGLMLIGEIELDMYLWQEFGKLGVGISGGYSTTEGNVIAEGEVDVADTSSFSVWPFRGSVIYRLDKWTTEDGFPLVPVAKLGLDLAQWSTRDTNGDVSSTDGVRGTGWKWGYHASLGIEFLLDIIDPGSAALFDLNWGVNNSYFFAEFVLQRIDNFGGDGIDLSDEFFLFGLNFEY